MRFCVEFQWFDEAGTLQTKTDRNLSEAEALHRAGGFLNTIWESKQVIIYQE